MSRSDKSMGKTGPTKEALPRAKIAKPNQQSPAKGGKVDPASKRVSKKERLIALLKTKGGVTVERISEELDWQRHTTRAALTGLRKAGFTILTVKPDGGGAGHYSVNKTAAASSRMA